MDIWVLVITVAIIIISIVCLYYMYVFKKAASVDNIIDEAARRAEYSPTIFKIYDKSTAEVCNRLIVVAPFDWYIWACRGELYILNPEGGIKCAANTTPAIQVLPDQFLETCLKLNLNSILDAYVNGHVPYVEPYEITTTTFTILSALNILMKKFITFGDTSPAASKLTNMKHLTPHDILYENAGADVVDSSRSFRVLSARSVISVTTSKNSKDLQKFYSKHMKAFKPKHGNSSHFDTHELDPTHEQYITLRQHARDADKTAPKMNLPRPNIKN